MGGFQAVGTVDITDLCLDAGGVSKAAEEFVGGEVSEPDPVHSAALSEDEFTGVEGEYRIADPCGFAFDFE